MSKTVWVVAYSGSSRKHYHTDTDCRGLKHDDLRETTKAEAEAFGKTHCKYCSGEYEPNSRGGGKSDLERILEAQDEDVAVSD